MITYIGIRDGSEEWEVYTAGEHRYGVYGIDVYEWGATGAKKKQLALAKAILDDHFYNDVTFPHLRKGSPIHYRIFQRDVIARLPDRPCFELRTHEINRWVQARRLHHKLMQETKQTKQNKPMKTDTDPNQTVAYCIDADGSHKAELLRRQNGRWDYIWSVKSKDGSVKEYTSEYEARLAFKSAANV